MIIYQKNYLDKYIGGHPYRSYFNLTTKPIVMKSKVLPDATIIAVDRSGYVYATTNYGYTLYKLTPNLSQIIWSVDLSFEVDFTRGFILGDVLVNPTNNGGMTYVQYLINTDDGSVIDLESEFNDNTLTIVEPYYDRAILIFMSFEKVIGWSVISHSVIWEVSYDSIDVSKTHSGNFFSTRIFLPDYMYIGKYYDALDGFRYYDYYKLYYDDGKIEYIVDNVYHQKFKLPSSSVYDNEDGSFSIYKLNDEIHIDYQDYRLTMLKYDANSPFLAPTLLFRLPMNQETNEFYDPFDSQFFKMPDGDFLISIERNNTSNIHIVKVDNGTMMTISQTSNYSVMRVDSSGTIKWEVKIDQTDIPDIKIVGDNAILMSGFPSPYNDFAYIDYDTGNIIWSKLWFGWSQFPYSGSCALRVAKNYIYGETTDYFIGNQNPYLFKWEIPNSTDQNGHIIKNSIFNFPASEWNRFCSSINLSRDNVSLSQYNFTEANTGKAFTASMFNEALEALSPIPKNIDPISNSVSSGDVCTAELFNSIMDSLNSG